MENRPLPLLAPLAQYLEQADLLLAAQRAGDPAAIRTFHRFYPRFLDPVVTWKPRNLDDAEIAAAMLDVADARLAVARGYSFRDWEALVAHVEAVGAVGSAVRRFETAAEAVIDGDLPALAGALRDDPALAGARSARVTCHDPPVHRATLLHYLAANGVEGYRQRSPANAVAVARLLLEAGAEVDALAGMYGGESPTLSMLVSSTPPAEAGVQVPLVHVLLDAGEDPDRYNPDGFHAHATPLHQAALAGHDEVVRLLVARGARLDQRDTLWNSTPLGWAEYAGKRETAGYLRLHGAP